jgi:hypothetical protein
MSRQPKVRPDSTGSLPPTQKNTYPDIPDDNPVQNPAVQDEPGLVGGPTTESIPGTAHDDPLDPLARPRETGGERPSNH